MTVVAVDLLREIAEAGGAIRLEGDMLRLSAPEPLPDELRARLRQHKRELMVLLRSPAEPADDAASETPAVVDGAAGLPEELAAAVRALLAAEGADGVPSGHWPRVRRDARQLVERGWLRRALALGWTAADLFGCDRRAPWYRLDRAGLVLLIGGYEVVEVSAHDAALGTPTGSVLRFRRRPPARPPVALLWELLIAAPATGPPSRGPTAGPSGRRVAATFLAGPRRHPDHDHPLEDDHGGFRSAHAAR